jgi:SAM-dependent methyltransferase
VTTKIILAVKRRLLHALDGVGLLRPAFRAREATRSISFKRLGHRTSDGFPVPPARLRVRVAGTADPDWFVEGGRLSAETVRAALARFDVELRRCGRLLDFGCGCGRVMRHWNGLESVELHGSDRDGRAVRWCEENLPFAAFAKHALAPPLPYPDASFDAIYAVSVFTHLAEGDQHGWLAELRRTLVPGGVLVLTTHGDRYLERFSRDERQTYEAGKLVVRWPQASGSNLCTAFHPHGYVRDELAVGFDLLELSPAAAEGTPYQDLVVLRRPLSSAAGQPPVTGP